MGKSNAVKKKVTQQFSGKKSWKRNLKQYQKNVSGRQGTEKPQPFADTSEIIEPPQSSSRSTDSVESPKHQSDGSTKTSSRVFSLYQEQAQESEAPKSSSALHNSKSDPTRIQIPAGRKLLANEITESMKSLQGRRVVDINHLFSEIYRLSAHGTEYGCTFQNMRFMREVRGGLQSRLTFYCNMCGATLNMSLNPSDTSEMDITTAVVSGAMSVGIGFSNADELFATMDIPFLSPNTYERYHQKVSEGWQKTALETMASAAAEEARYAIEMGCVDAKGTPLIRVVADGCWSKRSYRKNYTALSGVAAIVGQHFGQVLFIGVRNKYCTICDKAQNQNQSPSQHKCFKNFQGSSTSMEADILVEGFRVSEAMYGVKYSTIIADGDSSTYKRILEARPYHDLTVDKIECRNHLLRNFCTKLQALTTETRYPLLLRRLLKNNVLRMRSGVCGAIAHNKPLDNSITLLQMDIRNIICHVFGEHEKCGAYFCTRKESGEPNYMVQLRSSVELYSRIEACVQILVINARSLIEDVDSNVVEHFNAKVAKFVGGKRVNFSLKGSYQARCSAAVVAFNTRRPHYQLHKKMYDKSPSSRIKRLEISRIRKADKALAKRLGREIPARKKLKFGGATKNKADEDYGDVCQKPDMDPNVYEEQQCAFLISLEKTEAQREKLERDTVLQSGSGEWLEYRRKILTASNFHSVCTRRATTSCQKLVKSLLYGTDLHHVPAISHGRENEMKAIAQLSAQENVEIRPCGLFIHPDFSFLGASPDGIVGDKLIIEVKCPLSAFKKSPDEGVQENKIKFWTVDEKTGEHRVNTRNPWYYQIQGQLQITGRRGCLFGVWTGEQFPMKTAYIRKDNKFWNDKMKSKLCDFYYDCLLPELIDPRHTRSMQIRDPQSVIEAQQALQERKGKAKKAKGQRR